METMDLVDCYRDADHLGPVVPRGLTAGIRWSTRSPPVFLSFAKVHRIGVEHFVDPHLVVLHSVLLPSDAWFA